jgi:hypothetical protein
MAVIGLARLKETNKIRFPENTLTDYYDILHKLLEAKAISLGIKTRGEGAHQELIECIARIMPLTELERQLLQQIRELRNKISYDGLRINSDFLEKNELKINDLIRLLSKDAS